MTRTDQGTMTSRLTVAVGAMLAMPIVAFAGISHADGRGVRSTAAHAVTHSTATTRLVACRGRYSYEPPQVTPFVQAPQATPPVAVRIEPPVPVYAIPPAPTRRMPNTALLVAGSVVLTTGLAGIAAGAIAFWAENQASNSAPTVLSDAPNHVGSAVTFTTAGALVLGGITMMLTSGVGCHSHCPRAPVAVAVVPSTEGAAIVVGGSF